VQSRWRTIVLTLLCFVIGVITAAQWRTHSVIARSPILATSVEQAVIMGNLVESNARLREQVSELQRQLLTLPQQEGQGALQQLVDEITRLKIVNGLIEVTGPGLELVIAGEITVYDVQDVINELRNAGAEAIALNEQRLAVMSIVEESGRRIVVDGVTLTSPYTFRAIGDAETLRQACLRKGGVVDLLKSRDADIDIKAENRQDMTLPVYRRPYKFKYATIAK